MYEQVGRRKLVHDTIRHGRFTIIVNRGFIAFIKQNNRTLYKLHPLLAVQYEIQWLSYTSGSVLWGKYLKKSLKNQWFRAWHYRKGSIYTSILPHQDYFWYCSSRQQECKELFLCWQHALPGFTPEWDYSGNQIWLYDSGFFAANAGNCTVTGNVHQQILYIPLSFGGNVENI